MVKKGDVIVKEEHDNESWVCRHFGHKLQYRNAYGKSPKYGYFVSRDVIYCERCRYRKQKDTICSKIPEGEGVNHWGSGGVCMGCKKSGTCDAGTSKPIVMDGFIMHKSYMYTGCPINKFEVKDSEKNKLKVDSDYLTT